jgi:phenylalanyl-tRNA synthetase beta chain
MKASIKWIQEILGEEVDAGRAAERLTMGGVEIEEVVGIPSPHRDVVAARIVDRGPHPERSRLHVVTVDDGHGTHRVVCGAPNTPDAGGTVVFARPGAKLGAATIGVKDIAGVASSGMICSEHELAVGPDESGILVLDETPTPGTPLAELYDLEDEVLEFTITPNRPDCLGHIGLAREVAAVLGMRFTRPPPPRLAEETGPPIGELASVRIDDPDGCPRYTAAVVRGVAVRPSPFALRHRLHILGVRPIENIVDITNWVLLYDNQPLHAFDLRLLPGGEVVVRRARDGETIVTLDEVERELRSTDLVIASRERPIAVAGVMGGEGTAVRDDTTDVLIECAYFDPNTIRRTSARLKLMSESSYRFERGTDPGVLPEVAARAATMMVDLGGGRAAGGLIDVHPVAIERPRMVFHVPRAERIVGTAFEARWCQNALERLGCEVAPTTGDEAFAVLAPTYRPDLTREIDLIEEVARLRGYDTMESTYPSVRVSEPRRGSFDLVMRYKRALAATGLDEVVTLSFASARRLEELSLPGVPVVLANPLSTDRDVMRTSLLPGLLDLLAEHVARSRGPLRVFEVGTVFERSDGGVVEGVRERISAAALVCGPRPAWISEDRGVMDFHDVHGVLEHAFENLFCVTPTIERFEDAPAWLHPRSACRVVAGGRVLGWIGELHPGQAGRLDLPADKEGLPLPVGILEVEVTGEPYRVPRYRPYSTMPASERDLALVFPEEVEVGRIREVVCEQVGSILESVEVFDVFRGAGIPAEHKSVAFRMTMRAEDRTLRQEEVDAAVDRVVEELASELDGRART